MVLQSKRVPISNVVLLLNRGDQSRIEKGCQHKIVSLLPERIELSLKTRVRYFEAIDCVLKHSLGLCTA